MTKNASLLTNALRANVAFSAISGLTFIIASKSIAHFIGIDLPQEIFSIGVFLLVFAALLVKLISMRPIPTKWVYAVIVADLSWVLGTAIAIGAGILSSGGNTAAAAIATVVALLAALQFAGVKRLDPQPA